MITNDRLLALIRALNDEVEAGAEFRSGHQAHHVSVFLFDGAGHLAWVRLGCDCTGCRQAVADGAKMNAALATTAPQAVH